MALSHFARKEKIFGSEKPGAQPHVLELDLLDSLPERRIYSYFEVKGPNGTTDQWILTAEIIPVKNGQPVGVFPLAFGKIDTSSVAESLPSLFNAGGSVVGDSLVLRIANPFDTTNGPFTATLQPLRVNMEIDKLYLDIKSFSGASITGWRAYMACLSTKF